MAKTHLTAVGIALSLTLTLGACAGGGDIFNSGPTTAALPEKPKTDPACALLAGKLAELRKDGVVERTEQAAQGKGTTVSMKRESLTKLTELNKTNVEFQTKCSNYKPANVAQAAPMVAPAAQPAALTKASAAAATAVKTAAKAKAKDAVPPAVADAAVKSE